MPLKFIIAMLLLFPRPAGCQSGSVEQQEAPEPAGADSAAQDPSAPFSPGLDSLERRLALLEVAKARSLVASSDFWHRIMPQVSVGGGLGIRDLAFPDAAGAIVLPKDSYRLTVGLSLSGLIDGSEHARAEIDLAEKETRCAILTRRQSIARLALVRRKNELTADLAALREELRVRRTAVAYQELLFDQGRADLHSVAGARIDLIRLKHAVARVEIRIRGLEMALGGEPPE